MPPIETISSGLLGTVSQELWCHRPSWCRYGRIVPSACVRYGEVPYGGPCSGKEAEPRFPRLHGGETSLCTSVVRMDETHQTGLEQPLSVVVVAFSLFFAHSPPCCYVHMLTGM